MHDKDALLSVAPVNAWVLNGDEASLPTPRELAGMRKQKVPGQIWTAPSRARPGDVLFFYFVAPRKQIEFVARQNRLTVKDRIRLTAPVQM